MLNQSFRSLGLLLTLALFPEGAAARAHQPYDPWLQKPVLSFLYTDEAALNQARTDLKRTVHLSPVQQRELAAIAADEQRNVSSLSSRPAPGAAEVRAQNQRLEQLVRVTDRRVHHVLGPKYNAFRSWLRAWWNRYQP